MGLLRNLVSWAVGSYPAGSSPWSGTPMRATPVNAYFTPETTLPAEYANSVAGTIIDNLNAANTALALTPVKNWHSGLKFSQLSGGAHILKGAHGKDASGNNCFFAGSDGLINPSNNFVQVFLSTDGGKGFFDTSFPQAYTTPSSSTQLKGIYADLSGNALAFHDGGTLIGSGSVYVYHAGAWGARVDSPGSAGAGAVGYWDTLNNLFVVYRGGPGPGTLSFPPNSSSFVSHGAGTPPGTPTNMGNVIMITNGTCGLQIPNVQSGGGWPFIFRYITPGTTGTYTFPSFPIASTDVCEAVDWSPTDGFMISVWDGTNTYFMQSTAGSNGAAWTRASVGIAGVHIVGLVAVGLAWIANDVNGELYHSLDFGVSWTKSGTQVSSGDSGHVQGNLLRNVDATQASLIGGVFITAESTNHSFILG